LAKSVTNDELKKQKKISIVYFFLYT